MQNVILAGRTTRSVSKQPSKVVTPPSEADENRDRTTVQPETPLNLPGPSGRKARAKERLETTTDLPEPFGSKTRQLIGQPSSSGTVVPPLSSFPSTSSLPPAYSSSSDSDSDIDVLIANASRPPMSSTQKASGIATSNHPVINHPPVFSEGQVTAKELMTFKQDCEAYFLNAKGGDPKDQRVARIITAFKDPITRDWITSNRETLVLLKFEEFMKQLRSLLSPMYSARICAEFRGVHTDPCGILTQSITGF